jgi:Na+/proline symporter
MISPYLILLFIVFYFSLLMLISRLTSRRSKDHTYFDGNRESPWFLVAFGMIGSGISAVSLVSIPGNVGNDNLFYFQFILGTIVGYLFIAFVLIPIFHRLKLVSIYSYLDQRFGTISYRTGSLFFLVSQSFGAAFRLLLSVKILQTAFFDQLGIPHVLTVIIVLILIWLYTNKSGIKTIVWTDALQSFFLVTVIIVSILMIKRSMGLGFGDLLSTVTNHPYSKLFNWDLSAGSNFFKQFISGMLITIALVGLDQSMMQKSLTVSKLKDARKNVLSFSFFIAFAQMLFLSLGVLLYAYMEQKGIAWPAMDGRFLKTDEIYPFLTQNYFGIVGAMAFFIGVVASTFATIDSCITALTTAFSYDFLNFDNKSHEQRVKIKNSVLLGVNFVIFLIVIWFWNSQGAIINTIFKVAGYTYGPILGLYLLGLFTKIKLKEVWVPLACVAAAAITYWLNGWMIDTHNFDFGFMNILVNALLTILFLLIIKKK